MTAPGDDLPGEVDIPDLGLVIDVVGRLGAALAREGATAPEVAAHVPGRSRDDGRLGVVVEPVELAGIASVTVTRRWDSDDPGGAEIRLELAVDVEDLEPHLGQARAATRAPAGPRSVRFRTADDDPPWAVVAALGDGDRVTSLSVRRRT